MSAAAAGIGGIRTAPSATAAATKLANSCCPGSRFGLAGAAATNARPAAACLSLSAAATLGASLSGRAGITGSLRHSAGLSRFLGPEAAVPASSTGAATGQGCAATSTAWSLTALCPNVGTFETGNELPGIEISQAARISGLGPCTGHSAFATRSEGQLVHAGRQVLNGLEWSRTGTATPSALILCRAAAATAAAAAHYNVVVAFNQKGRRVLRAERRRLLRMYRKKTLLIHGIRSRIHDRENAPSLIVIRVFA